MQQPKTSAPSLRRDARDLLRTAVPTGFANLLEYRWPCGYFSDDSRRRHGCDVDIPRRRVAATPRLRRAYSVETGTRLRYEDNLVKGPSWSVGALLAPLRDRQLAAVTSAGAEAAALWEERCGALEASGDLAAELTGDGSAAREDALRALRALHKVLSDVGVSPLDLQRAAALT